jgi:DNA primase
VSTPLAWSDLVPTLDPSTLDVRTALARLDAGDPWGRFWSDLQPLPAVDPRGADERRRPRRRRRPVA